MASLRKTSLKSKKKNNPKSPNKKSLYGEKENNKVALMNDPYAVAWKMKSKGKSIDETVGHLLKELSQPAWFFLERGEKISGNVFEEKYQKADLKSC